MKRHLKYVILSLLTMGSLSLSAVEPPQIQKDMNGNSVAVWQYLTESGYVIKSSILPAGGSWTTPEIISMHNVPSFCPAVAMNDHGDTVAVWMAADEKGDAGFYASMLPQLGQWTYPEKISEPTEFIISQCKVTMNDHGDISAVWQSKINNSEVIRTATTKFGQRWSNPISMPN